MEGKSDGNQPRGVAVIGDDVAAVQAALTLAQMGVEVKLITKSLILDGDSITLNKGDTSSPDQRYLWPLLLQTVSHPLITLHSNTEVEDISGTKGNFNLKVVKNPRYINEELCSACGRCEAECSARVTTLIDGKKITHGAIHAPLVGSKSVPSAYVIEKDGYPPCRVDCPLGINIQGFISLLSRGKADKALALINESAPFSGILGRVCRHPCEIKCNRAKVDESVSIRALHRFAADNASARTKYTLKFPPQSRDDKVAIVGSGPAGLTAAWELTRRGYSPTVFESHSVIGGTVATGIPRFRLPREVRERDIKAIQELGVDIRTGITVGRDVTFSYLKERGYKAFFLAIGTQQNNKLNIPGEDLEGVVDCMSLLFTLNLRMDTFVGANIVIIGDGNSAIDSARAAIRKNKGAVKVLSWTIPEEITANEEEVQEALEEGVTIECSTAPVEIIGENGKVTGIRCRKTRLTAQLMANGRHLPEPIPDTDFVISADHVVVAIGQSPNASQLNIEGLRVDSRSGVIEVNPLTLETNVKGVFSGGDCITGPNNVVSAMAAGLRAAESIDRYLQGKNLEAERTLEPPPIAEVDPEVMEIIPYKRAKMPTIRLQKRINSFEETTTGLPEKLAQKEAERCLNCGLCSQCMECLSVCELGAVFHEDSARRFEIPAQAVLRFTTDNEEPTYQIGKAIATALETAIELKTEEAPESQMPAQAETCQTETNPPIVKKQVAGNKRIGVFFCRCNDSISSVIDFKTIARRLSSMPGVELIEEIPQACIDNGAKQIVAYTKNWQLDRIVLAACRCCNSEQVCYSCTDRRRMCLEQAYQKLIMPINTIIEFCNIREQCAWVHKDDPKGATRKALQIIAAGIARVKVVPTADYAENSILHKVLILGGGTTNLSAARALANCGYHVELVARDKPAENSKNLMIKPLPKSLSIDGIPGEYEVSLDYGTGSDCFRVGAVMINPDEFDRGDSPVLNTVSAGLLKRILVRKNGSSYVTVCESALRQITVGETAGIFLISSSDARFADDKTLQGLIIAARIAGYLEQKIVKPRATAVRIDSALCRACGNCTELCPYIEMRRRQDGTLYAYIEKSLCLGCGTCLATCPTGAISQPLQSDKQITATLQAVLSTS